MNTETKAIAPAEKQERRTPKGLSAVRDKAGKETGISLADSPSNPFKNFGGSECEKFNLVLLRMLLRCIWVEGIKSDPDAQTRMATAVMTALEAFKPTDEIEGMLASQAVALHFGALECLRRSMIAEQPSEIAARLRKDGVNMARAMTDMLEALDRKRGKGPQVMRIERVVVNEGGQAVVGNVTQGGRT